MVASDRPFLLRLHSGVCSGHCLWHSGESVWSFPNTITVRRWIGKGFAVLHSLHEFWRRHFVDDVPIEMDLCLDCGVLNCLEDRFKECPPRKARAAELAAERVAAFEDGVSPNFQVDLASVGPPAQLAFTQFPAPTAPTRWAAEASMDTVDLTHSPHSRRVTASVQVFGRRPPEQEAPTRLSRASG
jgi:hypothetical protein